MTTVAMLPTAILVLLVAANHFVLGEVTCDTGYEVGSDEECHAVYVHADEGEGGHALPDSKAPLKPYSGRVSVWANLKDGDFVGCEGTLVNWNAVLTVASCVHDATDGWIEPGVIDTVTDPYYPFGTPVFQGTNVHVHEDWKSSDANTHDIALIILNSVPIAKVGASIVPWIIRATTLNQQVSPVYALHHEVDDKTLVEVGPGTMTVDSVSDVNVPTLGKVSHTLSDIWDGWAGAAIFDTNFYVVGLLTSDTEDHQFDCVVTLWLYNIMVDNKPDGYLAPTYSDICNIIPSV